MLDRTKGHPLFYDLLEEMADLHGRKNSNYASPTDPLSNLRRCQALGISPLMGILVRLQDKWSRIENLVRGVPDEVGESLEDTLMDNAVYSLLAIILIREERNNKHEQNLTEAVNNEIPEEQIKQLLEEIRKRECQSW
jgi:uncharacterized protein YqgQ